MVVVESGNCGEVRVRVRWTVCKKSGHCIEVAVVETWPLVDKFNCVTYT